MGEDRLVIYGLRCKCHPERGVRYVGQSSRTARVRFYHHTYAARKGKPWVVSRWMRKHGIENIEYVVLEVVAHESELDERETWWIGELSTMVEHGGCNVWPGGSSTRGYKQSPEVLARRKGHKHSPETRQKLREANLGKVGELSQNSKLTNAEVADIKVRLWNGENSHAICRELGLSKSTIHYIEIGRTWSHVQGPIGPRRKTESGRFEPGALPSNTKLTDDQVREIRARYDAGGERLKKIAADYGITDGNVSMIGRRKTWAHIE